MQVVKGIFGSKVFNWCDAKIVVKHASELMWIDRDSVESDECLVVNIGRFANEDSGPETDVVLVFSPPELADMLVDAINEAKKQGVQ